MSLPKKFTYPLRFGRTKFITATEIRSLNARVVGPVNSRVHDEALLNHIVTLPIRQEAHGQERDLNQLAASITSNLVKNPVFAHGNKKTALLAAGLFKLQNGKRPRAILSQATGNDAMVEMIDGLSTGKFGETEYSELCRHLWRSTADSGATELWGDDKMEELELSVSSNSGKWFQTKAFLRSGSRIRAVECLVEGTSIILDKKVASLLTTNTNHPYRTIFHNYHLFSEACPRSHRLGFSDKHTVFGMLGLNSMRRIGVVALDEALDYSAINPSGTFGAITSFCVSHLAEILGKALRDLSGD